VVNEPANKDDKPFLVDDARQRLIDEVDRIRARKEQKGRRNLVCVPRLASPAMSF